jgi:hypothetical protein
MWMTSLILFYIVKDRAGSISYDEKKEIWSIHEVQGNSQNPISTHLFYLNDAI